MNSPILLSLTGQYMPSLWLLCVAMLVRALPSCPTSKPKHKKSDINVPGDQKTKQIKQTSEELGQKKRNNAGGKGKKGRKKESSMSIRNIGATYLLVHFLGYGVMNSPILLCQIGEHYHQPSEVSVYCGLIAISVLLTLISPFLLRLLRTGRITHEEVSLAHIQLFVALATVCLSVGMNNFPLGWAIAVFYTPVALVIGVVTKGGEKRRRLSCDDCRYFQAPIT